MYNNLSTTDNFPQTVVVRNTKDGMVWQIYHVNSNKAAELIAKGAERNGFEDVRLVDHLPNEEETFPNWRNEADVELRLLEGDNKIQYLINKGFITLADILEYAQGHMTAVDSYDDEQIDKYYQEEYTQEEMTEDEMTEGDYNAILENLYGKNPTGWVDGLENIKP